MQVRRDDLGEVGRSSRLRNQSRRTARVSWMTDALRLHHTRRPVVLEKEHQAPHRRRVAALTASLGALGEVGPEGYAWDAAHPAQLRTARMTSSEDVSLNAYGLPRKR